MGGFEAGLDFCGLAFERIHGQPSREALYTSHMRGTIYKSYELHLLDLHKGPAAQVI